jgi:hypothetical protein
MLEAEKELLQSYYFTLVLMSAGPIGSLIFCIKLHKVRIEHMDKSVHAILYGCAALFALFTLYYVVLAVCDLPSVINRTFVCQEVVAYADDRTWGGETNTRTLLFIDEDGERQQIHLKGKGDQEIIKGNTYRIVYLKHSKIGVYVSDDTS